MPDHDQVLRFAVGSAGGPRSRTWRLWVPRRKSDVYVSSRRVSNSVKVSLHEPGPSRFALTREFAAQGTYQPPEGKDPRFAVEWERPRTRYPDQMARPLSILVPWDEVREREGEEKGEVLWTPPPPEGTCVHYWLVYTPAGVTVIGHPAARSMGTQLVGKVALENGEQVFVTSLVRTMDEAQRAGVDRLRSVRAFDAEGNRLRTGMLGFGYERNPDADDGTFVGNLIDVTHPDEP
jgi:hypothetical protein